MASRHGTIIESLALLLTGLDGVSWGTPPVAVWFPDFTREDLRTGGLTAAVIAPNSDQEAVARGPYSERELEVHVAVIQPMVVESVDDEDVDYRGFAGGDRAVEVAETLANELLTAELLDGEDANLAVCVKCQFEPIISATLAKEHSLWVCYLKVTLKAGFN